MPLYIRSAEDGLMSDPLEFHYIIVQVWIKMDYSVIVLFGEQILLKEIFICHFEECLGHLMLLLSSQMHFYAIAVIEGIPQ